MAQLSVPRYVILGCWNTVPTSEPPWQAIGPPRSGPDASRPSIDVFIRPLAWFLTQKLAELALDAIFAGPDPPHWCVIETRWIIP